MVGMVGMVGMIILITHGSIHIVGGIITSHIQNQTFVSM
jgi:hypothetical protein